MSKIKKFLIVSVVTMVLSMLFVGITQAKIPSERDYDISAGKRECVMSGYSDRFGHLTAFTRPLGPRQVRGQLYGSLDYDSTYFPHQVDGRTLKIYVEDGDYCSFFITANKQERAEGCASFKIIK